LREIQKKRKKRAVAVVKINIKKLIFKPNNFESSDGIKS